MNEIAAARAKVNERVARYLQANPTHTYERVAEAVSVSRWRVLTVAAGLGGAMARGRDSCARTKTDTYAELNKRKAAA